MRPDLDLMAEPNRRLMLALIGMERELCVCELVAALDDRQPSVSRHLAMLRDGGWVVPRREGTFIHYRLADLPSWARQIVNALGAGGVDPEVLHSARARLAGFGGRPARLATASA